MFLLINIFILVLAIGAVLFLNIVRKRTNLTFVIVMSSIFLSWAFTLLLRFFLPYEIVLANWSVIFPDGNILLLVNHQSWVNAIVYQSILIFCVASYPSRVQFFSLLRAVEFLGLALMGILVLFAGNLLAYLFAWAALFIYLMARKVFQVDQFVSWRLIGSFLLIGLGWMLIVTTSGDDLTWVSLLEGSPFLFWFVSVIGIGISYFDFFADEEISVHLFLLRLLIWLFFITPLFYLQPTLNTLSTQIFVQVLLSLMISSAALRIIFSQKKNRIFNFSFQMSFLMIVFLMISGHENLLPMMVVLLLPALAFFGLNRIEATFVYVIRWLFLLLLFITPFVYGETSIFSSSSLFFSILFPIVYSLFFLAFIRIASGQKDAFHSQGVWLQVTWAESPWLSVERWARGVHWMGAIFLCLVTVGLVLIGLPQSLLDSELIFSWQLFIALAMIVVLVGLWRWQKEKIEFLEMVADWQPVLKMFNRFDFSRFDFLIRSAFLPEDILESRSGVFWTLLLILFVISLVL